jgi:aerobic carbon-monoxide dehydrogenase medium subunit
MKPAPFAYHLPANAAEAVSMLDQLGEEGRVLAGGQSLVPLMNFRLAQPAHLVDIGRLSELDHIRREDSSLVIGALARQSALERSEEAGEAAPLLVEAVAQVAHPPIRHRGTVCGSVAHADPGAELPAALLALGADVVLEGMQGRRSVPVGEFLTGPFTTAIQPGELVREVRAEIWPEPVGYAFVEYSRRHGDFAVAGAAVLLGMDGGRVGRAAIGLCGVAGTAVRATAAEELLAGAMGTTEEVEAASARAAEGLDPSADLHGGSDYRRRVARGCVKRALERAFDRVRGGGR